MAHIDAGKSTLADRFLELTGAVERKKMKPQFLDSMDLEQERGITIKMHPVRMHYKNYQLNLLDTPGHVDFNYEVSRSLAAVEGAVLLVDAAKGIQAQTIGNLELARKQNLVIIPVINKIDLLQARIRETEKEIVDLLDIRPAEIIKISAKNGVGVNEVLEAVIARIPPPENRDSRNLRALIFDSKYDPYKGILAFVRIFEGEVKNGDDIYLLQGATGGEAKAVGTFRPELSPASKLLAGEIGFIATGIKESVRVRVGETLAGSPAANPLPGYLEPQPKVFLSIYPENSNDFEVLKSGLEKLKLTDASLYFKPEFKESLGRGFQCGFLGLLHAEIVSERLKRESGLNIVLSTPSVVYKAVFQDKRELIIHTSADWPESDRVSLTQEIWAKVQILTPLSYLGQVSDLIKSMESCYQKTDYLSSEKLKLVYEMPLREIVAKNFYDKLKSATQGFASMDYRILGWRPVKLVKLDILILGKKEEAFSRIVPEKEAYQEGKKAVEKLKEHLPEQLFSVPLQAAVGGKIIARETMRAKRKDVIAPLYGGDYTRKSKLLKKQKKGKKELREKGKIKIPPRVFLELFKM